MIEHIPVELLETSPFNARRTYSRAGIEEMKASLLAHGQLQNLVAVKAGDGYQVINGGRRLAALKELVNEGRISGLFLVMCQITKRVDLKELSLAENTVREAMHPADEAEAFAELVENGESVYAIADRFGIMHQHVEKRLRLARLAPELLQEYRDGELTLDALTAFTVVDDHAAQRKARKACGDWINPSRIRSMLTDGMEESDGKLCRFVGLKTYCDAGGAVREDLFRRAPEDEDDAGDPEAYLEDAALLEHLAVQKLQAEAEKLRKQGWGWVEVATEFPYSYRYKFDTIEAKTKEQKAAAGCLVSIDYEGELEVTTGLVRREDRKKAAEAAGISTPVAKKEKPAISAGLKFSLEQYRLQVMQLALASHPDIATDLMIYHAALEVFAPGVMMEGGPKISYSDQEAAGSDRQGTAAGKALQKMEEALPLAWVQEEDEAARFAAFRILADEDKLRLLGMVVAKCLPARLGAAPGDPDGFDCAEQALSLTGMEVALWWRPTADNYLSAITREQLLAIGKGLFGAAWENQWKSAKKGELAAGLDKVFADPATYANGDEELERAIVRWLPEGMEFAAAPEKKPKGRRKAA